MNLHGIVSPYIATVNPLIPVSVMISTGYSTLPDGSRVPTYNTVTDVPAQIQALSYQDTTFMDGLNINGERRTFYLNGRFDSLDRGRGTGGDLIVLPDGNVWPYGTVWLIAMVSEQWPDWCHVIGTQQIDLTPGQLDFSNSSNSGLNPAVPG